VLGAILVATLPEIVRDVSDGRAIFGFDVETGRIAVFGLALILVMIYRPGGLLAARRRRTELSEGDVGEVDLIAEAEHEHEQVKTPDADLSDERNKGGV
jgi:hypothetical protein